MKITITTADILKDRKCECGDLESQHIDGMEECFIIDCGCKEFVEP